MALSISGQRDFGRIHAFSQPRFDAAPLICAGRSRFPESAFVRSECYFSIPPEICQITAAAKARREGGWNVSKTADGYAKLVGGILEENGAAGEIQKIYDSVLADQGRRVKEYSDYAKENPDYSGLKGTADEWLSRDDAYMAARLLEARGASSPAQAAGAAPEKSAPYSMDEVRAAGKLSESVAEMSLGFSGEWGGGTLGTEETAGLADEMSKMLAGVVDCAIKDTADKIGDTLKAEAERHALGSADIRGYAPLDKEDVFAVYDRTLAEYKATGDIAKALHTGADYGRSALTKRPQAKNTRASTAIVPITEDTFGGQLYSAYKSDYVSPLKPTDGNYELPTSTIQKYYNNINTFLSSLQSGNMSDVNFCFGRGRLSTDDFSSRLLTPAIKGIGSFEARA